MVFRRRGLEVRAGGGAAADMIAGMRAEEMGE